MAGLLLSVLALAIAAAAPADAPRPGVFNGSHPDSHAPADPPDAMRVARTPFRPTPVFHAVPGRAWRMTAGHAGRCRRHYRSYDRRTNRYVGRSGVRHVCLL